MKHPNDDTGDALNRFQENGFDLSKAMEIDFFIGVPSKKVGVQIALKAERLGFKVSVEKDEETGDWTCYCSRVLVPEYSEIVRIEKELDRLAKAYGGYVDGFGSYGN